MSAVPEALTDEARELVKRLRYELSLPVQSQFIRSDVRDCCKVIDALAAELERLQQEERRATALTFAVKAGAADVSRAELERVKAERDMEEKFANDYRRKLETALAALREIRDGGYEHFTPKGANPWARGKARAALSEIDE